MFCNTSGIRVVKEALVGTGLDTLGGFGGGRAGGNPCGSQGGVAGSSGTAANVSHFRFSGNLEVDSDTRSSSLFCTGMSSALAVVVGRLKNSFCIGLKPLTLEHRR